VGEKGTTVSDETTEEVAGAPLPEDGEWAVVELLGHRQRAGYVTEVTRFGAALLHIDLPAKLWHGDPLAWEEYAPSALYGLHPTTEAAVRAAWDRERDRHREEAAWRVRELEAGDGDPDLYGDEPDLEPFESTVP
jgi:hypothetical protein